MTGILSQDFLPWRTLPAFIVVLSLIGWAEATTYKPDKDALLAFKDSVEKNGYLINGWSQYTDPCIDNWPGVSCTCYPFFESSVTGEQRAQSCYPLASYLADSGSRVLQLNLGNVQITNWNIIGGELPPSIGNLTELRVLNLAGNQFWGPVPTEWSQLTELEILSLRNNNISGPLPSYLSNFLNLKYVFLDNNAFKGPIPIEWCNGAWWMFDVRHNPGLCDEVGWCLEDRLISFEGTSLIDVVADRDDGKGGYCDIPSPTCEFDGLACDIKIPNPPFWTTADKVYFSVPNHVSTQGGLSTMFKWRICSKGGECITDWTEYDGTDLVQSVSTIDPITEEKGVVAQLVHVVDSQLPGNASLKNGMEYYVKVLLYNAAGELNGVELNSAYVTADLTPPFLPEGRSVYNGEYLKNIVVQISTGGIGLSWDAFEDPESQISDYYYQIFEFREDDGDSYIGNPMTMKTRIADTNDRSIYISKLDLSPGIKYFGRITAVNSAGVESWVDSAPVTVMLPGEGIVVETTTEGVKVSSLVVVLAVVGSVLCAIFFIILLLLKKRSDGRRKASRMLKGQLRNLRQLLNNMSDQSGPVKGPNGLANKENHFVAFVITDLENSTGISSAAPRAANFVQEAHDTLLRDLIAAYGAYEINTEGDAFHVAFSDVSTAIQFCMEIQYEMMEIEWPKEVLSLPGCEALYSKVQNGYIYRGPRIRMGIHWAEGGHVNQELHSITKHRIYSGAAFQITRELCEAAKGGQVLMTHAVWERLKSEMDSAGFPVVEQLGSYAFQSWQKPIWIYQIRSLLGKPLHRPTLPAAGKLNNLKVITNGSGLAIVSPPSDTGRLTFMCIKLDRDNLTPPLNGDDLPLKIWDALYETILVCAMQYQGYGFRTSTEGYFYLVFTSCVDAVRMSHLIQALMMCIFWPSELQEWCGKEETSADGKLLFKGPRLSIGIHESSDYSIRPIPQVKIGPEGIYHSDYVGRAEEISRAICDCAYGGQIVLSEDAWSVVQHQLPGGPTVISLGTHIIDDPSCSSPMMLIEVMPKLLSKRTFPRPKNTILLEPGYRDAPTGDAVTTIAHLKVVKPEIVVIAEKMSSGGKLDGKNLSIVAAYAKGISMASKAIRSLLKVYEGYECKEPQPGSFTIAFAELKASIQWAAAVQNTLLNLDWPEEILNWAGCEPIFAGEYDSQDDESCVSGSKVSTMMLDSSNLIWRGLSVHIGMASGALLSKAPLNTGRADYFGTIPNLAARLVKIARPGQTLFDASRMDTLNDLRWNGDKAYLPSGKNMMKTEHIDDSVYLMPIGQIKIKGFDDLRSVYQADAENLQSREFDEIPGVVRTIVASSVSRRISSLRRASEASNGFHPTISGGSFPSQKPGIFASISRSKDSGSSNLLKRLSLSMTGRNLSRGSDTSDYLQHHTTSICQSETSSAGGSLLKHALFSSAIARKQSESSAATTPRSYMSHDIHHSSKNSPLKTRLSSFKHLTDGPNASDDGNRYDEASSYTDTFSQWNTPDCNTPTVSSKIDRWDMSLAEEDRNTQAKKQNSSKQADSGSSSELPRPSRPSRQKP